MGPQNILDSRMRFLPIGICVEKVLFVVSRKTCRQPKPMEHRTDCEQTGFDQNGLAREKDMGMQQVLLIVLAVILVGIAIVIGISMFSKAAYNSNTQAIMVELEQFRASIKEYWMLPTSMGGVGKDITRTSASGLAKFLGFSSDDSGGTTDAGFKLLTGNGEHRLIGCQETLVQIVTLGKEQRRGKYPYVSYNFNMLTDEVDTEVTAAEGF